MVVDLEDQELVYRLQSLGVAGLDSDPGTCRRLLQRISDGFALLLHHRDTWRHGVMDEHRNFEVVGAEHGCDVDEVSPDLISGGGVALILGVDLDDAAIRQQLEMMFRRLEGEAHGVLPALIYAGCVRVSLTVKPYGAGDEAA